MNKKYLIQLAKVFLKIRDQKEMIDFLEGILTPKELEEIPKRLAIVKMLKKGIPQKQIANKLKVAIATITRGSNELKKGRFKNI